MLNYKVGLTYRYYNSYLHKLLDSVQQYQQDVDNKNNQTHYLLKHNFNLNIKYNFQLHLSTVHKISHIFYNY